MQKKQSKFPQRLYQSQTKKFAFIGFILSIMLPIFSQNKGYSQSKTPKSTARSTSDKGQRLLPPLFGRWRTGELIIIEQGHIHTAMPIDPINQGDLSMLPPDLLVEFRTGYDRLEGAYLSIMNWLPPFPVSVCQYGATRFSCLETNRELHPKSVQDTVSREFNLFITKEDVFDTFGVLGATAKDVCYRVRGNGHSWEGRFYIARDRQTMWQSLSVDVYVTDSAGKRREPEKIVPVFQVYRRQIVSK